MSSETSVKPVPPEVYAEYYRLIEKFENSRNEAFNVSSVQRTKEESEVAFHLALAVEYQTVRWSKNSALHEIDNALTTARKDARKFVEFVNMNWETLSSDPNFTTLRATAANVYMFCAPLDAANWCKMKSTEEKNHQDVNFRHFDQVLALNFVAEDIHVPTVKRFVADGKYPTSGMADACSSFDKSHLPDSLIDYYESAKAAYGFK